MSKVYIVCGGWNYEGYNNPEFVTMDIDKARDAQKQLVEKKHSYDYVDIFEHELDNLGDGKELPPTETVKG